MFVIKLAKGQIKILLHNINRWLIIKMIIIIIYDIGRSLNCKKKEIAAFCWRPTQCQTEERQIGWSRLKEIDFFLISDVVEMAEKPNLRNWRPATSELTTITLGSNHRIVALARGPKRLRWSPTAATGERAAARSQADR